jgi:signal transduction histidine kinase
VAAEPVVALARDPEHGIVGGVLAGIAERTGISPLLARILFVLLVVATGGVALVGYAIAWLALPARRSRSPADQGSPLSAPARSRLQFAAGVGLVTLAVLLGFRELGLWWSDALVWPLVLAASGVAVLWQQQSRAVTEADPEAGAAGEQRPSSLFSLYRGGFGIALVVGAALLFLSAIGALGAARDAAFTSIVVVLALSLILAPFLWRLGRNLAAERAERIRTQEKAELAAHLHDSVLQTLTLIQKRSDEPEQIAALARTQERELRSWLAGDDAPREGGFARALTEASEAVEDAHRVSIDIVIVGDCEVDERSAAMVAAAREALTNAARFAGPPISVYAEIGDGGIDIYVRDRGPGFDPDSAPEGRRGIRESIIGRMQRHGGRGEISSSPETGTEVRLKMERSQP